MAFAIGIRLASYAVAGAALIITHKTTKATKEKLRQWVADKFTSRSSDPAPEPPNPCDARRKAVNEGGDFVNGGTTDIQESTLSPVRVTEDAIKADPMAEGDNAVNGERPAHLEEPTLTAVNVTENAVEGDPTVEESQRNQDNGINVPVSREFPSRLDAESNNAVNGDLTVAPLQRHGINPTREAPALVVVEAVSLEATGVHPTVDDVDNAERVGETRAMDWSCQTDSDERAQDARDPAPLPGRGIQGPFVAAAVNAVKNWARSLFNLVTAAAKNWARSLFNLVTAMKGYVLDPKRDKMQQTLVTVGLLVLQQAILEALLQTVWRKIYNIVKNFFWCWWPEVGAPIFATSV